MRLVILDSALKGRGGHHYAYDVAVAEEARRRGLEVVAFANAMFPAAAEVPFEARPVFSCSCYDRVSKDPITADWETFRLLNPLFKQELEGLGDAISPYDLVWVPTITENQLRGLFDWLWARAPERRPRVVVTLLTPAGVISEGERLTVVHPMRALYFRMILTSMGDLPVRLIATGGQLARDYSYLAQREIPPHPLPINVDRPLSAALGQTLLLSSGETAESKGIHLLPDAVRRLALELPDWRLLVHGNDETTWQEVKWLEALKALQPEVPGLEVRTGYLSSNGYSDLLDEAAVVVMPYNQNWYRARTSGVLWDAIAAGRPVIVPARTALEREALAWNAPHVAIETASSASITRDVVAALRSGVLDANAGLAAAERFRAGNGLRAFVDDLLRGAAG